MKRTILPPHPVGETGERFLASLGKKERDLHVLATERLGTSYFVDKSLGFKKWVATTTTKPTATTTTTTTTPTTATTTQK